MLSLITPGDLHGVTGTEASVAMDKRGNLLLFSPDGRVRVKSGEGSMDPHQGVPIRPGDVLHVMPCGGSGFDVTVPKPHILKHLALSDLPGDPSETDREVLRLEALLFAAHSPVNAFDGDLVALNDDLTPFDQNAPRVNLDFPKPEAILVLGASPFADCTIAEPGVSRRHLQVRAAHPGILEVRDISTLGTHRDDGSGSWLRLEPEHWTRIAEDSLLRLGGKEGAVLRLVSAEVESGPAHES